MTMPVRYFVLCLKRHLLGWKPLLLFCSIFILLLLTKLSPGRIPRIDSLLRAHKTTTTPRPPPQLDPDSLKQVMTKKKNNNEMAEKNKTEMKMKWWKERMEKLSKMRPKAEVRHVEVNETVAANYNVHVFYYAWYENEAVDGGWQHWNHEYLENWRKNDKRVYPSGRHKPPDDIGSNFYPKLGCYSSRDPRVVDEHMKQIRDAGIGVLIVSWYPPGMSDGSSRSPDAIFGRLLDAAEKHGLKLAPHIEPYRGRNPANFLGHLKYFTSTYGNHPALYRTKRGERELGVYYVYDSYRTPAVAWRELLSAKGNMTLRGTPQDGIFLGLLVDAEHRHEIKRAKFDGFYTYFATNGFSYGSSWKNWKALTVFARLQNLIFIPSIGPGYIDTRVRPWNFANTRHRRRGKYYEVGWRTAIGAGVDGVSITSFNEWHEGTQIEAAVAKSTKDFVYLDYEPEGPEFYMNLTKYWISQFSRRNAPTLHCSQCDNHLAGQIIPCDFLISEPDCPEANFFSNGCRHP